MSDATDAIEDIIEAINEYGSTITLNIITVGTHDTVNGGTTGGSTASVITKALPKNYTSKDPKI